MLCESGFGFPSNNLSKLMVTDVAAPPILAILCFAILCLAFASCPPFSALLTSTISCTKPLAAMFISVAPAHLWGVILLSASQLLQQIMRLMNSRQVHTSNSHQTTNNNKTTTNKTTTNKSTTNKPHSCFKSRKPFFYSDGSENKQVMERHD